MTNESPFWSLFGKFSAVVTTIGAIVGIWVFWNQASEEIDLRIESWPYTISPDLSAGVADNLATFSYTKIYEFLETNSELSHESRQKIATELEQLHTKSWSGINNYNYDDYSGLSNLTVQNLGDIKASDIKVDFPGKGIVLIAHPDAGKEIKQFDHVIPTPDIRAKSKVQLFAWTNRELSEYDFKKIVVSHSNGLGSVSWPVEATGIGWLLTEYKIFSPLFFYIVFTLGMLWASWGRNSKNTKENNSPSEASEDTDA